MHTKAALLILFSIQIFGKPLDNGSTKCGYDSCPKVDSSTLNVHVIPHSHDDVGWLKTVSQYYYGSRTSIQRAGVQYIISSVVEALLENPERRFIQVETAFLHKWWQNQDDQTREDFKKLINNGQLEIIGGGWSMNDEAAVHYQSTIDQFTLGLEFINDTLGECGLPKIGWQIDPFGHSKEMASIFAHLGFDAFFVARVDYRDKALRLGNDTAEMVWRGSESLGEVSDIFTSVTYNNYAAPQGFCFDILCSDDPIIDDPESPEYNYEEKVLAYSDYIQVQARQYKTNNILITMGEDFQFQDANSHFFNLDKLIKGFQIFPQTYRNKSINVFYSTPSCYIKAVNDEAVANELIFPVKSDDFFPYASDPHAYWTGYFTSRPTSKRFERQGNNFLQVAKQISTLNGNTNENLRSLREAVGIMQHHDAITGTEKQHVADDYHRILTKALVETFNTASAILSNLLKKNSNDLVDLNFKSCLMANVSYCPESQSQNFISVVYNPLSRNISHYVQLPVNSTEFRIIGPDDQQVKYQIALSPRNFNYTKLDTSPYTLIFYAENIPPLGAKLFRIIPLSTSTVPSIEEDTSDTKFIIGDNTNGAELDKATGKIKFLTLEGEKLEVDHDLLYYVGARGNNSQAVFRASGAYVFRPDPEDPVAVPVAESVVTRTYRGELFDEIHQEFDSWATQVVRVYKDLKYVEFDWIVGPLHTNEQYGKEIISRFSTNLQSNDTFYTDSNGRQMIERIRNYRDTYTYTDEEPQSGNYYPVTSRISIKDEGLQFSVLNDRAQGGSSLASGQLELMIQRRCVNDDRFGVGEALDEIEYSQGIVVRGQHFVTFGSTPKSREPTEKAIAQEKILAPWVFVSEDTESLDKINFEFAGLSRSLPEDVQILTLEPWKDGKILVRLENILEASDDKAQNVEVDLNDLFNYFDITLVRETTLAGNQWLEDNKKLKWISEGFSNDGKKKQQIKKIDDLENLKVTLEPMQIRTFIADVLYKNN